MTSLILNYFNLIDKTYLTNRLTLYETHYSNPKNTFNFEGLVNIITSSNKLDNSITSIFLSNSSLLEEYISVFTHTVVFGTLLYFILCLTSYFFFFKWKKETFLPNFKNKKLLIYNDIKLSLINIVVEAFLVAALRMIIPRYSLIYYDINDYSLIYVPLSIILHMLFDETLTYWVHRIFHTNRFLYKLLHKYHHESVDITPFAGFAFHPIDAFCQALGTFISCFFFPLHINVLMFFSFMTTSWAISIHDNVPVLPLKLFLYSTHHTIHHEEGIGKFRNYGKFTTIWDRLAGTYSDPDRIDYGFVRSESVKKFFIKLNNAIDYYIPDNTPKKKQFS